MDNNKSKDFEKSLQRNGCMHYFKDFLKILTNTRNDSSNTHLIIILVKIGLRIEIYTLAKVKLIKLHFI